MRSLRLLLQKRIKTLTSSRKFCSRISVCERNSKTPWSSKIIINSGGKSWARRWCRNRRRRQKKKKKRRFVVYVWRIYLSTLWRTSFEFLRSRSGIPDPIGLQCFVRHSDECKQCIRACYERCHCFWGRIFDYKIPRLSNKTLWRIQIGKWKTYEDPKEYQIRQKIAWSLVKICQEIQKGVDCIMGRGKCHTARITKITSRWLLMLIWYWIRILLLLCRALGRMTTEGAWCNCNFNWCWWKTIRFSEVCSQHMDPIAEEGCEWSFHSDLVHKRVLFKKFRRYQKPKSQINNGTNWRQFQRVEKVRRKSEVIQFSSRIWWTAVT